MPRNEPEELPLPDVCRDGAGNVQDSGGVDHGHAEKGEAQNREDQRRRPDPGPEQPDHDGSPSVRSLHLSPPRSAASATCQAQGAGLPGW